MNQTLQSGHPDIEQLSAFLSHALPPYEQDATVAHLAECTHCRSIVFQLQDISVEAKTDSIPASTSAPWFKHWKWIVPIATFSIALVIAVLFVNRKPLAPPSEIASAPPPPVMRAPVPVDKTAPAPLPHKNHHRSASPQASSSTPGEIGGKEPGSSNDSLNRPINGREQPTLIPLTPNSSPSGNSTPETGGQPAGIAGGAVAGMIAPVAPVLPSGTLAVASASSGTRTLALDREGNLFLTDNGGRTWQQHAHAWDGKAVTITFSGVPKQTTPEARHGSVLPRGRFELRTDAGALWFSFDGIHWTKKTP